MGAWKGEPETFVTNVSKFKFNIVKKNHNTPTVIICYLPNQRNIYDYCFLFFGGVFFCGVT